MKRALVLSCVVALSGCSTSPDTEPLRPGTCAVIVAWVKSPKRSVRNADFYDDAGPLASLMSGTKVIVAKEQDRVDAKSASIPKVRVHVQDGPLAGHIGKVLRPHLRKAQARAGTVADARAAGPR